MKCEKIHLGQELWWSCLAHGEPCVVRVSVVYVCKPNLYSNGAVAIEDGTGEIPWTTPDNLHKSKKSAIKQARFLKSDIANRAFYVNDKKGGK